MHRHLPAGEEQGVSREDFVRGIPGTNGFKTPSQPPKSPAFLFRKGLKRMCPLQLPVLSFHRPVTEPWTIAWGWRVRTDLTNETLRLRDTEGPRQ